MIADRGFHTLLTTIRKSTRQIMTFPQAFNMSSSAASPIIDQKQLSSFHEHLKKSKRVLALLGAGLSASSGLPTFRGAGGLWRTHDSVSLATPEAFEADPGLVVSLYLFVRTAVAEAYRSGNFTTTDDTWPCLCSQTQHTMPWPSFRARCPAS